ncbi:MAG: trypsin-like peptidase domain-containing protein, partial [Eubacteriales bacterium]|nr:trypsin-like peptidase domain-containing protein [Eubacteriales bacterium]
PTEAEVKVERVSQSPDYQMTLMPQPDEALSLQELYEKCAPSVISISGYVDKKTGYSWGSGVIISEDGLILTNAHILEDCDRAVVELDDGTEYEALLVGSDSISDIALLKIEAEGLPAAELGESASLRVGDSVAAIGNPLGESFRNTLTDGIISAIERDMTYQGRSMTLLQTNTAVNEGNSGGALFNRFGQVIGLTNMKMMSSYSSIEGIGFAIPSSTICKVVNALIRDGEVRGRPAIGITVGSIPENAKERYSLPDGLYISMVSKGSDAEKQGIREGDVLTAVNGIPVTKTTEVSAEKDKLEVGDTMVLTIWRDGESFDVEIALVDTNDIYS